MTISTGYSTPYLTLKMSDRQNPWSPYYNIPTDSHNQVSMADLHSLENFDELSLALNLSQPQAGPSTERLDGASRAHISPGTPPEDQPSQSSHSNPMIALENDSSHPNSYTAPKHVWRQIGNVSTIKSLSHLIVQVSVSNVTTYLCGWDGCTHTAGFVHKAQLLTHIRSVHLQEKPFRCTTCGTNFARKQEAVRHVNSMNNGKIYKCSFCRRGFVRKLTRDHHEDTCTMVETPQSSSSGDGLQNEASTE